MPLESTNFFWRSNFHFTALHFLMIGFNIWHTAKTFDSTDLSMALTQVIHLNVLFWHRKDERKRWMGTERKDGRKASMLLTKKITILPSERLNLI